MQLTGIHHLTAISADISRNHAFYTGTLGMRLVKKSVNQDDVSAYHLFYADGRGSPGSDLTFFDFPVPRERRGTRSIARTGLRVAGGDALGWWAERLAKAGVSAAPARERDGRQVLDFEDFEGQRLALVADDPGEAHPWTGSPVPGPFQIRGLGPIALSVPDLRATDAVLTGILEMRKEREYAGEAGPTVHVYAMGPGGPAAELHIALEPNLPPARQGAGGVHHVAFRVPDDEQYQAWAERLNEHHVASSGPVNRYYFRSLYFREPTGILFELATDTPGFAVDEPVESLGTRLALPPFLEPRRKEIEAGLKPL